MNNIIKSRDNEYPLNFADICVATRPTLFESNEGDTVLSCAPDIFEITETGFIRLLKPYDNIWTRCKWRKSENPVTLCN